MLSKNEIILNNTMLISDILSKEEKDRVDFRDGIIDIQDMSRRKKYEVMICNLDEETILVKPIKKYKCMVFEELFGFGYECQGFSKEKKIKIKIK